MHGTLATRAEARVWGLDGKWYVFLRIETGHGGVPVEARLPAMDAHHAVRIAVGYQRGDHVTVSAAAARVRTDHSYAAVVLHDASPTP